MEGTPSTPPLPMKTRIAISIAGFVTDLTRRPNGTVNRRLLNALNVRAPPYPDPVFGFKSYDVTVDRTRNLWFRVYLPITQDSEPAHLPVIFFYHGGGFVYLSADSRNYDAVCRRFCIKIPAVMVSVNYRLAPEYRHPAQYNDGFDALKYIDENNKKEKILPDYADMSCCFLVGDSAGGNIAHHVAVKAAGYSFQQLKVIGLVAIQPFFGGEERTEAEKRLVKAPIVNLSRTDWMWKAILPDSNRDHEAINVSGPQAVNLSALPDFPATMVVVSGFDILQDWQRRYYEWLRRHNKEAVIVEYPTMIHAFYVFPELLEAGYLVGEIRQFVHNHMSKTAKGIPYVSM